MAQEATEQKLEAMRTEKDSLGELQVPASAYYGVQTARAVANFPISGLRPNPAFVRATVQIKKAAAIVNARLGELPQEKADAIVAAADEVLNGNLSDQFVVDVFQAGAGTSHNMNTNEVLANRAIEIIARKENREAVRGDYKQINPNDHVNMAQSTNDVIPTAIRLAALQLCEEFYPVLERLQEAFAAKAHEFDGIIKSGRTHLQDAVPIRLGQEFAAYAVSVGKHRRRLHAAAEELKELGIGGTAAGSELNAHPRYREEMARQLSTQTGLQLTPTKNTFEAMQSMAPFVGVSGALRNLALDMTRIANDLRLLASGPRTGLAEIELPPVQPGSSIMPGKVNPVLAEMLNMVCYHVIGNDTTVAMASQAGQLELNVMMPIIAHDLLEALTVLRNALDAFAVKCVRGITADAERCREYAEKSLSLITALNPHVGYLRAAEIAKEMLKTKRGAREVTRELGLMDDTQLDEVLDLEDMTGPQIHTGLDSE
ncbi:MAG TPA: aspartate ammonia-lyase [Pyrinomonadaceae bacterium]|jgi:aspartate ammonia-lyase|nr:aspartate ammonia-lyase [Pyrinomonadaceae bacterium]